MLQDGPTAVLDPASSPDVAWSKLRRLPAQITLEEIRDFLAEFYRSQLTDRLIVHVPLDTSGNTDRRAFAQGGGRFDEPLTLDPQFDPATLDPNSETWRQTLFLTDVASLLDDVVYVLKKSYATELPVQNLLVVYPFTKQTLFPALELGSATTFQVSHTQLTANKSLLLDMIGKLMLTVQRLINGQSGAVSSTQYQSLTELNQLIDRTNPEKLISDVWPVLEPLLLKLQALPNGKIDFEIENTQQLVTVVDVRHTSNVFFSKLRPTPTHLSFPHDNPEISTQTDPNANPALSTDLDNDIAEKCLIYVNRLQQTAERNLLTAEEAVAFVMALEAAQNSGSSTSASSAGEGESGSDVSGEASTAANETSAANEAPVPTPPESDTVSPPPTVPPTNQPFSTLNLDPRLAATLDTHGALSTLSIQSGFLYNQVISNITAVYGVELGQLQLPPVLEWQVRQQIISVLYTLSPEEIKALIGGDRSALARKITLLLLTKNPSFVAQFQQVLLAQATPEQQVVIAQAAQQLTAQNQQQFSDIKSRPVPLSPPDVDEATKQAKPKLEQAVNQAFFGQTAPQIDSELSQLLRGVNPILNAAHAENIQSLVKAGIFRRDDPELTLLSLQPLGLGSLFGFDGSKLNNDQAKALKSLITVYWHKKRALLFEVTGNELILVPQVPVVAADAGTTTSITSPKAQVTPQTQTTTQTTAAATILTSATLEDLVEFNTLPPAIQQQLLQHSALSLKQIRGLMITASTQKIDWDLVTIASFSSPDQLAQSDSGVPTGFTQRLTRVYGTSAPQAQAATIKINHELNSSLHGQIIDQLKQQQIAEIKRTLIAHAIASHLEQVVLEEETDQSDQFTPTLLTTTSPQDVMEMVASTSPATPQISDATASAPQAQAAQQANAMRQQATQMLAMGAQAAATAYMGPIAGQLAGAAVNALADDEKRKQFTKTGLMVAGGLGVGLGMLLAQLINFIADKVLPIASSILGGVAGAALSPVLGPLAIPAGAILGYNAPGFLMSALGGPSSLLKSAADVVSKFLSSGGGGATLITNIAPLGTVAIITAGTTYQTMTLYSSMLSPIPTTTSGEVSPYVSIEKVATNGNNFETPEDITYSVTISAKDDYRLVVKTAPTDTMTITYNTDPEVRPEPGSATPPSSDTYTQFLAELTALKDQEITSQGVVFDPYTIPFKTGGDFNHASIINRINFTFDVYQGDTLIESDVNALTSETVCFGQCSKTFFGCFTYGEAGFSFGPWGYPGSISKAWEESEKTVIEEAFNRRMAKSPGFIEKICNRGPVFLYRLKASSVVGSHGWSEDGSWIVFYDLSFDTGNNDPQYTFAHELGHILDARNDGLRTSFFDRNTGGSSTTGCYSYPLETRCKSTEAFADASAMMVTGDNRLPGFKTRYAKEYNWFLTNVYGNELW